VIRPRGTASGSLGRIVQAFKSITTHQYVLGVRRHGWPRFRRRLWRRNYYERLVRNARALEDIRAYIAANPGRWWERHRKGATSP
jgi:REP element-mobilizing transposase RayT